MTSSAKVTSGESKQGLEVFFTKDQDLLNQYYQLRHEAYKIENGWEGFDGSENENDRHGMIVVAMQDGQVIGGIRLMFSDQCRYLSNEIPGTQYEYQKFIRKYDSRENLIIGEISALVVKKSHRDNRVTSLMFEVAFGEAKKHGCNYVFAVAIAVICRMDRITLGKLGYDVDIVINYPWKEKKLYNFTKMFPMYTKLC